MNEANTVKDIKNETARENEEEDQHCTVTVIMNEPTTKYGEETHHATVKVIEDNHAVGNNIINQFVPVMEEFTCKYCEKSFKARTTMHKHQINCKANVEGRSIPKLMKDGERFYCGKCQQSFNSKTSGYRHTNICITNYPSCKHVKTFSESETTKTDRSYYCHGCEKNFKCRQSLYKHEKYCGISYSFAQEKGVVDEEYLECDNCGKSFESALSLHKHGKICEINSFICNICGEAFGNIEMLCVHKISHTSADKPKELCFNKIVQDGEKFLCKRYNSCSESMKISHKGTTEGKQVKHRMKGKNVSGQYNEEACSTVETFVNDNSIKDIKNEAARENGEDQHCTAAFIVNEPASIGEENHHSIIKVIEDDHAGNNIVNQHVPVMEEFICKYCGKGFKARTTMHKHQIKCKANVEGRSIPKLKKEGNIFYCSICQQSFNSKTAGYRHSKTCI